ncbi:MAG: hypothetical protein C5B50_00840 [Verrucomicrobia bacterium]|nr:MAG: hypothetical protein C5B50_00840 [Verrucomicrobiota bacterium]
MSSKLTHIAYFGAGNSEIRINVHTCTITIVDKTTGVKNRTASIILDQRCGLEFGKLLAIIYEGASQEVLEQMSSLSSSRYYSSLKNEE